MLTAQRPCSSSCPDDKLLRARKLRMDTTVVEADIDYPTDADLLEHAVRKLGGLVRRVQARGAATHTALPGPVRAAGRRLKQISKTLRRRTGRRMGGDRLTAEVAMMPAGAHASGAGGAQRPPRLGSGEDGWLRGWWLGWTRRSRRAIGCCADRQRLAGNRVIGDRLIRWRTRTPGRSARASGKATEFGYTVLLAEDERGFIATHQTNKGNPGDAAQLVPRWSTSWS